MRNCNLQFGSTHAIEIVLFIIYDILYVRMFVCPGKHINVIFVVVCIIVIQLFE